MEFAGLPDDGSDGEASAYKAGDPGSVPGWGRSPGGGNGNPLQYSCLENPMDRSLVGCSPRDGKELDMTEQLHFHLWSLQYMWGNIDDVCSRKSGGHRVAKFLILMVFTWNSVTFKLERCEKVVVTPKAAMKSNKQKTNR